MVITGFSNDIRFLEEPGKDIILNAIPTTEDRELSSENKYVLRCYFPGESKGRVEYIDMFTIFPNDEYERLLEEEVDNEYRKLAHEWCLMNRNLCVAQLNKDEKDYSFI